MLEAFALGVALLIRKQYRPVGMLSIGLPKIFPRSRLTYSYMGMYYSVHGKGSNHLRCIQRRCGTASQRDPRISRRKRTASRRDCDRASVGAAFGLQAPACAA